jgi:hypothetical protein
LPVFDIESKRAALKSTLSIYLTKISNIILTYNPSSYEHV